MPERRVVLPPVSGERVSKLQPTPRCPHCNLETSFQQTIRAVRDNANVHLYECVGCAKLFFFQLVDGDLRSWP